MSEGIKGLNLNKEDPVMFLPSGKMMDQVRSMGTGEESWDPSPEVGGESGEFGHGMLAWKCPLNFLQLFRNALPRDWFKE